MCGGSSLNDELSRFFRMRDKKGLMLANHERESFPLASTYKVPITGMIGIKWWTRIALSTLLKPGTIMLMPRLGKDKLAFFGLGKTWP